MPTRSMHRRFTPAALALALPGLMGSHCGLALDYTETWLITDPVEMIVIVADDGNVDAAAYDRDAILFKRHVFAYESILESPSNEVTDEALEIEAHCKDNDDFCSFDHMFEMPYGVGFDITMDDVRIDIGYVDADIVATYNTGRFKGIRLATPQLELTAHSSDVDADFTIAPQAVMIDIDAGDVTLALPAGEYRCMLDTSRGETMVGDGVVCDDAAVAVLDVQLRSGDILITEAAP